MLFTQRFSFFLHQKAKFYPLLINPINNWSVTRFDGRYLVIHFNWFRTPPFTQLLWGHLQNHLPLKITLYLKSGGKLISTSNLARWYSDIRALDKLLKSTLAHVIFSLNHQMYHQTFIFLDFFSTSLFTF